MTASLNFVVRAIPVAKARHKTFAFNGKGGRPTTREYIADKDAKQESEFISLADPHRPETPFTGALRLDLLFVMPIPPSWPKWQQEAAAARAIDPTVKPDLSNLVKLVEDCLNRAGGWWRDDSMIVAGNNAKVYGVSPGTHVTITELHQVTRAEWLAINGSSKPAGDTQPALL
jgi:Holliday junction resolvase RusA-like endonuclease